jgi:hypothetical protein
MNKLDTTIEKLIEEKNIKTKWSEIECHGMAEFVNMLFQEKLEYGSVAQMILVENHIVYMSLLDGIPFKGVQGQETLIKVFIDVNDNVIFLGRSGNLYLYETEGVDAEDLRHYFGKD